MLRLDTLQPRMRLLLNKFPLVAGAKAPVATLAIPSFNQRFLNGSTKSTIAFFEFVSTFIGTSSIVVGRANSIFFAISAPSLTMSETVIFVIATSVC